MNQKIFKNLALWTVILMTLLLFVSMVKQTENQVDEITFSAFQEAVRDSEIEEIVLEQGTGLITGEYSGGAKTGKFSVYAPVIDNDLIKELAASGLKIEAKPDSGPPMWKSLLITMAPFILIVGVWIFFIRQMQAGGGKAMSFGKSRARLLNETDQPVTFDDVAGAEESKAELEEIIDFLREPKKFTRLGARIPKGVLLVGTPGTGKTLLARAVAGEAGVPFFSISGSDFVEMFVGVGASRVRDLFQQGLKNAPCIIFIDEIDAVGRHRGAGMGGGHDEREQTLNQLLVEMDGFSSNEGVILIAATNRPDVLDPALLRPGRFDRRVVVPLPDLRGRLAILRVHTKGVPMDDDVDLEILARGTPGFSGADLQNLVNEAALLAAKHDGARVEMRHFEGAKDKVTLGTERRSLVMSEEDKRMTAYHEGGHALVAMMNKDADPVHKVTIIPRGMALGLTLTMPTEDQYSLNKNQLTARIQHAMGGRAAEDLVFDEFSTGASNDLKQATALARSMVCDYGMSERIGPVYYGGDGHDVFLGRDLAATKEMSEKTAENIDLEIKVILEAGYTEAKRVLTEKRDLLDCIAEALLERETLDREDLALLLEGKPLPPIPLVSKVEPARESEAGEKSAPKPVEEEEVFPGTDIPDAQPLPS